MTGLVGLGIDERPDGAARAQITLRAPRSNALTPEMLTALAGALDGAARAGAAVISLASGGRNFCSGGDVARFARSAAAGEGAAYARDVVPRLQEIVLRLVSMPALVTLVGRGAITGGGAGLLFAADLAVLTPDTFVQPYYTAVGFAPDGGWTALLPELIGPRAALAIQVANRRLSADDCVRMGLACAIDNEPEQRLDALLDPAILAAAVAAKRLVWDAQRLDRLRDRLSAEAHAFEARIDQPDTARGMARFLEGREHG